LKLFLILLNYNILNFENEKYQEVDKTTKVRANV